MYSTTPIVMYVRKWIFKVNFKWREYLIVAIHDMQCSSVVVVIIFQHDCRSHTWNVLTNSPSWIFAHQLWLSDRTERHLLHVHRFPDSTCMSVPSARFWSLKPVGSHIMVRLPPACRTWSSCTHEVVGQQNLPFWHLLLKRHLQLYSFLFNC